MCRPARVTGGQARCGSVRCGSRLGRDHPRAQERKPAAHQEGSLGGHDARALVIQPVAVLNAARARHSVCERPGRLGPAERGATSQPPAPPPARSRDTAAPEVQGSRRTCARRPAALARWPRACRRARTPARKRMTKSRAFVGVNAMPWVAAQKSASAAPPTPAHVGAGGLGLLHDGRELAHGELRVGQPARCNSLRGRRHPQRARRASTASGGGPPRTRAKAILRTADMCAPESWRELLPPFKRTSVDLKNQTHEQQEENRHPFSLTNPRGRLPLACRWARPRHHWP